jgi:hypothetical protein
MASTKKDDLKNENISQSSSTSTSIAKSAPSFASSNYQQLTTASIREQQQQPLQNEERYQQYLQVDRSISRVRNRRK